MKLKWIAAASPPRSLPTMRQFFLLCGAPHNRKAWLFVGNHEASETAAKLITLTKTCNRLHIDPLAYLQDVYARLPMMTADELPSLLPDRWLQEHPEHILPERVREAIERAQRAAEERPARRRAA